MAILLPDPDNLFVDLLQAGQTITMTAHGQSMHPFIQNGDNLQVTPVTPDKLKPGDIVFCILTASDGTSHILIHRLIVRQADGTMIVRGDNCGRADPPLPATAVIGQLQRIGRGGQTDLYWPIINWLCGQLSTAQLTFDRRYQQAAAPQSYLWRLARQLTTAAFLAVRYVSRLILTIA